MSVSIGQVVPDFEAKDHNGETIRLSNFKGKKVSRIFFAHIIQKYNGAYRFLVEVLDLYM